jgi:hypothetical protein
MIIYEGETAQDYYDRLMAQYYNTYEDSDGIFSNSDPEVFPNEPNMLDVLKVIKNIDEIPLFMYKSYNNSSSNTECLICYDPFESTDIIRVLPCSHIVHRCCIDDYFLNSSHCCPYCKMAVGEYVYKNL